jgi:hypothetical protein
LKNPTISKSSVATAVALLQAFAERRDEEAWKRDQALAGAVLGDTTNVLARRVLDGGPFAMREAEELAEIVSRCRVE